MLKKCVVAAEELASKLPPASTPNPGGEQGGWLTILGWFTTGLIQLIYYWINPVSTNIG